jgi:hypothetical protein
VVVGANADPVAPTTPPPALVAPSVPLTAKPKFVRRATAAPAGRRLLPLLAGISAVLIVAVGVILLDRVGAGGASGTPSAKPTQAGQAGQVAVARAEPSPTLAEGICQPGGEPTPESCAGGQAHVLADAPPGTPIVGYMQKESFFPGQRVELHLNAKGLTTTAQVSYRVAEYRTGATVLTGAVPVGDQPIVGPAADSDQHWPVSTTFRAGSAWRSGVYFVSFGNGGGQRLFFVVRDLDTARKATLVIISTATAQAYNTYGGKSLYGFNSTDLVAAARVSLNRPYAEDPDQVGCAFGCGYERTGAAALATWLDRAGYDPAFATDQDLHLDPTLLTGRRLVVFAGHDEYWTNEMRDHVDAYLDAGGNMANFAGNTSWWRIRYEGADGRTMVCYRNAESDPVLHPAWETTDWQTAGRSAMLTFGAGYEHGAYNYAGLPGLAYIAYNTDHWLFAGTALTEGATFGQAEDIAPYEVDGIDTVWVAGKPTPRPGSDTPTNYVVLGYAPTVGWDNASGNAAMGIYTHRGGGIVFNAATVEWGRAFLGVQDSGSTAANAVVKITDNLLQHVLGIDPTLHGR